MSIRIAPKNSTGTLRPTHCFNRRSYLIYGQEYGVIFIISLLSLLLAEVGNRKLTRNALIYVR
jgi:hypothetical protein